MVINLRGAQRSRGYPCTAAIHALAVDEVIARSRGHGCRIVRVYIIVIINVIYIIYIINIGIINIYTLEIAGAAAVPRMVDLTETKRKPTDPQAETAAETRFKTKAAAEA
jgi:hypothetical protein